MNGNEDKVKIITLGQCPYCDDHREIPSKDIVNHLIITQDSNNHFHIHGPIENRPLMAEFIRMIAKEAHIKIED